MEAELKLIGIVELRIALATGDAQLEKAMATFLCPLLLKLASPYPESRQAALKVIGDFHPRIKASSSIRLPVASLLAQVREPNVVGGSDVSTVRIYTLIFLAEAIRRLNEDEGVKLMSDIVNGFSTFSLIVQAKLFGIFLSLLPQKQLLDLAISATAIDKDWEAIFYRLSQMFLLSPNTTGVVRATPGLSIDDVKFLSSDAGTEWSLQSLKECKLKILRFFDAIPPEYQVYPLVVASIDPSAAICDPATGSLKKIKAPVIQEFMSSETKVTKLVNLCVGAQRQPPLSIRGQVTILTFLRNSDYVSSHRDFPKLIEMGLESGNRTFEQIVLQYLQKSQLAEDIGMDMVSRIKEELVQAPVKHTPQSQVVLLYETFSRLVGSGSGPSDLSVYEFLFDRLEMEPIELRQTIQDVLSSLTVFLPRIIESYGEEMLKMLRRLVLAQDSPGRYMAIKYINCGYDFSNAECRYLCAVALASANNGRQDVVEEAQRGLHPHWWSLATSIHSRELKSTKELLGSGNRAAFPEFGDFVRLIDGSQSIKVRFQALEFAIRIAEMKAVKGENTVVIADDQWETRLSQALQTDSVVRELMTAQLRHLSTTPALFTWFDLMIDGTINSPEVFANLCYQVLALSPSPVAGHIIDKLPQLLPVKGCGIAATGSDAVAKVVAIVGSHPSAPVEELWQQLIQLATPSSLVMQAHLLARLYARQAPARLNLDISYLESGLEKLFTQPSQIGAALDTLNVLASFGAAERFSEEFTSTAYKFIESRVKKLDEKAVSALGGWSISFPDQVSEQSVYETHTAKQVDYLFTSGEALAAITGGWNATNVQRVLDIPGNQPTWIKPPASDRLIPAIQQLLEYAKHTKPALRRATCIWLLSLVEYCGHLEPVRNRAGELHLAFMRYIADRDDFVQDAATRGLALVYEMGDHDMKDTLVRSLLRSFTDSNTSHKLTSGTVDEDTELFAEEIGKGEGSISSYRDVLTLAQDVGDPSLVYKFMAVAKSSALWSSRKGMAFGLGAILSKTSLDSLITSNPQFSSRLIPKLYRYKFDPVSTVADSMSNIWRMVVPDSTATITEYLDAIIKELLKSMGSKEWRVREAATSGLTDLVALIAWDKLEPYMGDVLTMSFRVMDDIKDSVRKSGQKLAKGLAQLVVRVVETKSGPKVEEMLSAIIPFLLGNQGLGSDAEEVREFALKTVIQLCKKGGKVIQGYVAEIIDTFIHLMSTVEPQVVNYVYLNAEKYGLDTDALDAQRITGVGRSPLMESIEDMIGHLSDEAVGQLLSKVTVSVKSTVGLPSKVGCAKVIVSLVSRRADLVRPYSDGLLRSVIHQTRDRNSAVASAYAAAAGQLCRLASFGAIDDYATRLQKQYFDSEDNDGRVRAAFSVEGVAKSIGGDKFDQVSSMFLPLAFVGKFDDYKQTKQVFERVWVENVGSNARGILLYYDEIESFCRLHYKSPSYHIRRTLARAVTQMEGIGLADKQAARLVELLIDANSGKSWDGKHLFLQALVGVTVEHRTTIGDVIVERVARVVDVESKRRSRSYQEHAVKELGRFIGTFPQYLQDEYIEVMTKMLSDKYLRADDDSDDDDSDEDSHMDVDAKRNIELEEWRLGVFRNLEVSFSPDQAEILSFIFATSRNLFNSKVVEPTWRSQIAVCEVIGAVVAKANNVEDDLAMSTWRFLESVCGSSKCIENVRIQFVRMSGVLRDHVISNNRSIIENGLERVRVTDPSTVVKAEVDRALER